MRVREPIDPPDGFKWAVTGSWVRPRVYELGLWREELNPANGLATMRDGRLVRATVTVRFDKPRQLRRASKRAYRKYFKYDTEQDVIAQERKFMRDLIAAKRAQSHNRRT